MAKVIFTVFAGRKRFLTVLWVYVRRLLSENTIDEVHLWDYCDDAMGREYIRTMAPPSHHRIRLMKPPAGNETLGRWTGYYAYYAEHLTADNILIKCDDDVVFIGGLPALLAQVRRDSPRRLLYYPSTVNNDVAAAFQAADGVGIYIHTYTHTHIYI